LLKRTIDLVGASLGVLVFGPFCLLIALLIRLTSKGPILFVQERIGRDGKPFKLLKYRTMHLDTDRYAPAPEYPDDPRVTPIGRWLRRFSFDELPQLLNVLGGSMSLVGPRPEMAFHVDQYSRWQRQRLKVKPGLTGLWQIHGRSDIPLHKNLEYDLYYVRNQSLFLDYRIMLKTVFVVLFGRGAY
jgi:exopolysaccharide biosynthesis polyprenyl glycosylphosphotransferase